MKLPELDLACGFMRPALHCIKVTQEFTYASDAHIAVKHKSSEIFKELFIESIPEEGILIPANAFKIARKKTTKNIKLSDDKKHLQLFQEDGSEVIYSLPNDNYPDIDQILPDKQQCVELKEIALNPTLLARLGKAMGKDNEPLHLSFFGATKTILCDCNGHGDYYSAIGIIMPAMINT